MATRIAPLGERKTIALVAHDHRKPDLVGWVRSHRDLLARHHLVATGTTGRLIEREVGLPVERVLSGPLGGDQQIGAKIASGEVDLLIFFWDPLEPQPHDPDIRALLRIGQVWNIPIATNRSSADFLITSPWMARSYPRAVPEHDQFAGARDLPSESPSV